MTSYGDFLKDAEGIIYQTKYLDNTNKERLPFKLLNFALKATPKEGIAVNHSWTRARATDEKQTESDKSKTVLDMKHGDVAWQLQAAESRYIVDIAGPLMKDEWEVEGNINWDHAVIKDKRIFQGNIGIASPDMSGTKANIGLGVEHTIDKDEQETCLKFDCGLEIEKDILVGVEAAYDMERLSNLGVLAAKKDDGNKYWAGYSRTAEMKNKEEKVEQTVKAGCLIKYDKGFLHAYEARYNLDNKDGEFMGNKGVPLVLAGAGKYNLSDKTSMNYMLELMENVQASTKFVHKVDKNWAVSAKQSFEMKDAHSGRKPYAFGFEAIYTL